MENFVKFLMLGLFLLAVFISDSKAKDEILVFSGAAFKAPVEEIVSSYSKETGKKVYANFGSVIQIVSQLNLSKKGDVIILPSMDIMESLTSKQIVLKESIKPLTYQVPVLVVAKGNPKKVKGLRDLLREDLKIAIANPESVYIGMLAAEILEKNFNTQERDLIRKKTATYANDVAKLLNLLLLKQVDLIVGFDFFEGWVPDKVDVIKLEPKQLVRVGTGAIGILAYSKNKKEAENFLNFLVSKKEVFKRYGYRTTPKEIYQFIGTDKIIIGGSPVFGEEWFKGR